MALRTLTALLIYLLCRCETFSSAHWESIAVTSHYPPPQLLAVADLLVYVLYIYQWRKSAMLGERKLKLTR